MDPAKGTGKGEAQPPLHQADFGAFSADDTLDLFLLAGQSNMKGRATISMTPRQNGNILFLHPTKLTWYVARDPLHALGVPDLVDGDDNAGTGPGMTFARCLAETDPDRKVGLIPAAVGGAPIDAFGAEGELYLRSLTLAAEAAAAAPAPVRVKAILWLQGESDAMEERHQVYQGKLLDLVDRYRADLKDPGLPFIACTIGSFIEKEPFQYAHQINEVLLSLPQNRTHTACVDARDLEGHIGDRMHYDLESQVEIGRRFAATYGTMHHD